MRFLDGCWGGQDTSVRRRRAAANGDSPLTQEVQRDVLRSFVTASARAPKRSALKRDGCVDAPADDWSEDDPHSYANVVIQVPGAAPIVSVRSIRKKSAVFLDQVVQQHLTPTASAAAAGLIHDGCSSSNDWATERLAGGPAAAAATVRVPSARRRSAAFEDDVSHQLLTLTSSVSFSGGERPSKNSPRVVPMSPLRGGGSSASGGIGGTMAAVQKRNQEEADLVVLAIESFEPPPPPQRTQSLHPDSYTSSAVAHPDSYAPSAVAHGGASAAAASLQNTAGPIASNSILLRASSSAEKVFSTELPPPSSLQTARSAAAASATAMHRTCSVQRNALFGADGADAEPETCSEPFLGRGSDRGNSGSLPSSLLIDATHSRNNDDSSSLLSVRPSIDAASPTARAAASLVARSTFSYTSFASRNSRLPGAGAEARGAGQDSPPRRGGGDPSHVFRTFPVTGGGGSSAAAAVAAAGAVQPGGREDSVTSVLPFRHDSSSYDAASAGATTASLTGERRNSSSVTTAPSPPFKVERSGDSTSIGSSTGSNYFGAAAAARRNSMLCDAAIRSSTAAPPPPLQFQSNHVLSAALPGQLSPFGPAGTADPLTYGSSSLSRGGSGSSSGSSSAAVVLRSPHRDVEPPLHRLASSSSTAAACSLVAAGAARPNADDLALLLNLGNTQQQPRQASLSSTRLLSMSTQAERRQPTSPALAVAAAAAAATAGGADGLCRSFQGPSSDEAVADCKPYAGLVEHASAPMAFTTGDLVSYASVPVARHGRRASVVV